MILNVKINKLPSTWVELKIDGDQSYWKKGNKRDGRDFCQDILDISLFGGREEFFFIGAPQ